MGHSGSPGSKGGPEYYLKDSLNLNIVYSVYEEPKTREEIAQELGVTPVIIDDKLDYLEGNGFLIPVKGGKYTTYVRFSPEKYPEELEEKTNAMKQQVAQLLVEEYVPLVHKAMEKIENIYIPSNNQEVLEALAVCAGVINGCGSGCSQDSDCDYIYEHMNKQIADNVTNKEKYARLRKREFINADGKVEVMIYKGKEDDFFGKVPLIPEKLKQKIRNMGLENAMMQAKLYPPQMQDLVVHDSMECFPDNEVALRVMDILYGNGTYKALTTEERITSQFIMFSDILPERR